MNGLAENNHVFNHEFHRQNFYYPSNMMVLGSADEFKYFNGCRWSKNVNHPFVKRLYDSHKNVKCPCLRIMAFNCLGYDKYDDVSRLYFSNEYPLKTNFFHKKNFVSEIN